MNIFLSVLLLILVLWSAWGYFSSNVEQAEYTVIEKRDGYEIRQYAARIVAQTRVAGSYEETLNKGFEILAGYIFGANTRKDVIAMTAPVTTSEQGSEEIAMTAPVVASSEESSSVISFSMPKKYTLDSLPTPSDSRVEIVEVPEKKIAARRFFWFRTPERVAKEKAILTDLLAKDKVEVVGKPAYAGYNAPWTPPWMTRNEILVEIK